MADAPRDFFISFNSADEAYAKAINDALRAEGFTTFFDQDDLEYGGYVPKWMNDALLNSRQMLALCSPEYMDDGAIYSEAERYGCVWQDTRGEKFKFIPVVLRDVTLPPLLATYKRLMATNTTPAQAAAAVVAALKKPEEVKEREALRGTQPNESVRQPVYVHTARLPETGYERLVGRDAELERLDKAWLDARINTLSLVAEGGAGKSALVNEWIKRMQAHGYPGAEVVLGWSFYSQGTTERATSAEEFLNWSLEKLGIVITTTSPSAKADAMAEAMMQRRVLLLLDGVEPLQHGPGPQVGQLKDLGLRALLRRFAATAPGAAHGKILLTSRLAIKDISRWRDAAAQVIDVGRLSNEAGAALLQDNGVKGPDNELESASHEFGGHPLALGLLASLLKETQHGDVRRRDHIRAVVSDTDNPGHDHARRVMESYEKEWLVGQPILLSIMLIAGLFDRPAGEDCLDALRAEPAIENLTDLIVTLDDVAWHRAVARLREVRLLAPLDPTTPNAVDTHPLIREWFGERLRQKNQRAYRAAHRRLYEHLRDTTTEGTMPTLRDLAPLYQAIRHGCGADRPKDALSEIYKDRICRFRPDGSGEYYASIKLGADGSNLAAISWFFRKPYELLEPSLAKEDQGFLLNQAAHQLGAQGRLSEAITAERAALRDAESDQNWINALIAASNLCEYELCAGNIAAAAELAQLAGAHSGRVETHPIISLHEASIAKVLHMSGQHQEAERKFAYAERLQRKLQPGFPLLYAAQGYSYNELRLAKHQWVAVRDRALQTLEWGRSEYGLLHRGLDLLALGRAHLGLAIRYVENKELVSSVCAYVSTAAAKFAAAMEDLKSAGQIGEVAHGLLCRVAFRRNVGDWGGVLRDLDEIEEIAEPASMRLHLCDLALERTRLAFARMEVFAPLNGRIEGSVPILVPPKETERIRLREEASEQLAIAIDYIEKCGYHRRDVEHDELQAVLRGERTFASLPPRV
jgi:hypothetical protein